MSSATSSIMSSWPPTVLLPAELDQDVARRHAVLGAGALGEQQERRVHAGVAEDQRVAIDADRLVHHRHDDVLGDVHQLEDDRRRSATPMRSSTATNTSSGVLPAPAPRPGGRAVDARRRPPRSRRASWRCPSPGCDGRGSRSRSRAASSSRSSADPRRDVVGQHVAGRVGAVDAVRAVALHQLRLRERAAPASIMCAIIRKPTVSRPSLRDSAMCCSETSASVQCVATRMVRDAAVVAPCCRCVDRADARAAAAPRPSRCFSFGTTRAQVLLVAVRGEAVVDRGAAQAVAVGDLDQRHAGRVERGRDRDHLLERDLVALRVHAVAQAHVVQDDLLALQIHVVLRLRRPWVAARSGPRRSPRRSSRRCAAPPRS